MDAFLKCLLAFVMSLVPTGTNSDSPHLLTDKQLANHFASQRDQYQHLIWELLLEDTRPSLVLRDSKESKQTKLRYYSSMNSEMRDLGIRKILLTQSRMAFRLDETETSAKDLVWQPYAFSKCETANSESSKISRIDDDWALVFTAKKELQPQN